MTRRKKLFSPKNSYDIPGYAELLGKKFRRQRVFHAARTAIQRGIFLLVHDTPTEHHHTGKINYVPSLKKSKKVETSPEPPYYIVIFSFHRVRLGRRWTLLISLTKLNLLPSNSRANFDQCSDRRSSIRTYEMWDLREYYFFINKILNTHNNFLHHLQFSSINSWEVHKKVMWLNRRR